MKLPAFSLIDTMVALIIALTAFAGLAATQHSVARHRADALIAQRAWRLLDSVARLPVERLVRPELRAFDWRGLPDPDKPFYELQVSHAFDGDTLVVEGALTWSLRGQELKMRFTRKEWYPYDPTSL